MSWLWTLLFTMYGVCRECISIRASSLNSLCLHELPHPSSHVPSLGYTEIWYVLGRRLGDWNGHTICIEGMIHSGSKWIKDALRVVREFSSSGRYFVFGTKVFS